MALTNDIRRTLADRVERKVAGRGISRRAVEDAVDRVAGALAQRLPTTPSAAASAVAAGSACGCAHGQAAAESIAVLSASTVPDLASRVRDALGREGVAAAGSGVANAGRHTVVTLRVAAAAEAAVRRVAERLGASVTVRPLTGLGDA